MLIRNSRKSRRGSGIDMHPRATKPVAISPFKGYDWSKLSYSGSSISDESKIRSSLEGIYALRRHFLPFLPSFERWYALYRVYMGIGDAPREVLSLMARNFNGDEIAEKLNIARSTVDAHVRQLKQAFGANTKEYLVVLLIAGGVLVLPEDGESEPEFELVPVSGCERVSTLDL